MRPVLRYAFSLVLLLAFPAPLLQAAPDPSFGPIEVLRDRYGVPHVFSDTDAGAMYGLGSRAAVERIVASRTVLAAPKPSRSDSARVLP